MSLKEFRATGMQHHQEAFEKIRTENEAYDLPKADLVDLYDEEEKIWKYYYDFDMVELVPEPENEHDPNAVAVHVDGNKVANIKKGNCSQVKNLLSSCDPSKITADIGGGPYKLLVCDDDDGGELELMNHEAPLWVHVLIDDGKQPEPKTVPEPEDLPTAPEPQKKGRMRPIKTVSLLFGGLFSVFGVLMALISPACALFVLFGIILILYGRK